MPSFKTFMGENSERKIQSCKIRITGGQNRTDEWRSTLTAKQQRTILLGLLYNYWPLVLGGGNFTKTSCYDEAHAIPTQKSHLSL